jgi:hypothetical protein
MLTVSPWQKAEYQYLSLTGFKIVTHIRRQHHVLAQAHHHQPIEYSSRATCEQSFGKFQWQTSELISSHYISLRKKYHILCYFVEFTSLFCCEVGAAENRRVLVLLLFTHYNNHAILKVLYMYLPTATWQFELSRHFNSAPKSDSDSVYRGHSISIQFYSPRFFLFSGIQCWSM